jgi:ABC-type phosphate transport system substrate-binding protein
VWPFRNDAAITATNPALTLPAEPIIVVQMNFTNDVNLAASRLCTKVDAGWAAAVGVSRNPALPHVVGITTQQSLGGLASFVIDTPYSIGFLSPVAIRVKMAQLINRAGVTVPAIPATVSQATIELIANGFLPGGDGYDLTDAQSAYAWPMSVRSQRNTA